jgi:D-aminopeptidase
MSSRRARDLGLGRFWGPCGPHNAITDVPGVRVGHATLIRGDGPIVAGRGPVRTGVTVILPRPEPVWRHPVFAGCHRLNGNGELTGLEWVRESGMLSTTIGLTNTHSVGVVRDALVALQAAEHAPGDDFWALPVVGETWDGRLNDVNGQHVRAGHVRAAVEAATGGPVAEGNVGGGTGMICHGFKGGIGTASRVVGDEQGSYTVGILVQANHGRRDRFTVEGVPVGRVLGPEEVPLPQRGAGRSVPDGAGSIIGIIATDAPLLPHQCARLAQRAGLGIARLGAVGDHSSGDLFLAFATGNTSLPGDHSPPAEPLTTVTMLPDARISPLYAAVVDATEEAVLNALLAAETMTGRDGVTAHALPADRLLGLLP